MSRYRTKRIGFSFDVGPAHPDLLDAPGCVRQGQHVFSGGIQEGQDHCIEGIGRFAEGIVPGPRQDKEFRVGE